MGREEEGRIKASRRGEWKGGCSEKGGRRGREGCAWGWGVEEGNRRDGKGGGKREGERKRERERD